MRLFQTTYSSEGKEVGKWWVRALVGLSLDELAEAARVSKSTVHNFERGRSVPNPKNMADIIAALKAAGVVLIPENGGGPGVRLAKTKARGLPSFTI